MNGETARQLGAGVPTKKRSGGRKCNLDTEFSVNRSQLGEVELPLSIR